jgi:chromosomal replication initiation ATPase DnaA
MNAPDELNQLLADVMRRYGVTRAEIHSKEGSPTIVRARHAYWAIAAEWSSLQGRRYSNAEIGRLTGHDNTTVLAGLRRHRALNPESPSSTPDLPTAGLVGCSEGA